MHPPAPLWVEPLWLGRLGWVVGVFLYVLLFLWRMPGDCSGVCWFFCGVLCASPVWSHLLVAAAWLFLGGGWFLLWVGLGWWCV